jgi:glycosyltransferase involved in cell wall biosynthesis
VDPGDEDALAAALLRIPELDVEHCRREAARRFTPERMARRYLRLYEKVLAGSGRRPLSSVAAASGQGSSRW